MGFGLLNACAIGQICLTDKHTDIQADCWKKTQAFATLSTGKASKPPNADLIVIEFKFCFLKCVWRSVFETEFWKMSEKKYKKRINMTWQKKIRTLLHKLYMDLDHQSLLADFQHFIDSLTGGSALEICTLDTSNYNCCALKPKFSFISMAVAQMVQVCDSKSVSLTNKNVYNTNITIYQFRNIMFLGSHASWHCTTRTNLVL